MNLDAVKNLVIGMARGAKLAVLKMIVVLIALAGLVVLALYSLSLMALYDLAPEVAPVDGSSDTALAARARMVARPGGDGAVRIYSDEKLVGMVRGHEERLERAILMAHARELLSWSRDGTARLTRIDNMRWRQAFETGGPGQKIKRRLWKPFGAPLAQKALAITAQYLPLYIPQPVRGRRGASFRDCSVCPQMVEIGPGSFLMGSTRFAKGANPGDRPRHVETMPQAFAVGKYEVTRGEFDAFVRDAKYQAGKSCFVNETPAKGDRKPASGTGIGDTWVEKQGAGYQQPGFAQTDRHPAVCVSLEDARAYVKWLSTKIGKTYRLLTSAEWEYVARAGTVTPWPGGASVSSSEANFDRKIGATQPVGSYGANPFGLYDLQGNVSEWVEGCYDVDDSDNPVSKTRSPEEILPASGTSITKNCADHERRGGSWVNPASSLRSAARLRMGAKIRDSDAGFRVARSF